MDLEMFYSGYDFVSVSTNVLFCSLNPFFGLVLVWGLRCDIWDFIFYFFSFPEKIADVIENRICETKHTKN